MIATQVKPAARQPENHRWHAGESVEFRLLKGFRVTVSEVLAET